MFNIHNLHPDLPADLILYKKMQLTYVIKKFWLASLNFHFTYPNLRFKH